MSQKKVNKAFKKLEEIANTVSGPVEMQFKDGRVKTVYIEALEENQLIYASQPPDSETEYGSMVDPRDLLSKVFLYELAYVRVIDSNQKVSLMPFQ